MKYDEVIEEIAGYVTEERAFDRDTLNVALLILKDSMGCMIKSLDNPQCKKMVGPIEAGDFREHGMPVPGISGPLGLLDASWNIGMLIRWLDYNDCFLAEEWGHPSDNLGGILAASYHVSSRGEKVTVGDVLQSLVKAHEIQGVLSLSNSLNRVGYDHVFFVKLATSAVVSEILGGDAEKVRSTVSNAFADGAALRIYRHAPNVTTRKSWAAGDATMRGVRLALLTDKLNEGYPDALSEPDWGFNENMMGGNDITLRRKLDDYVVNNILFKADFPAEFHGQTAAEAAMALHSEYRDKLALISEIRISTHESAVRIIAGKSELKNPSDRDHSLEYIIAVSLLNGDLKTEYYADDYHDRHPEIDHLMSRMVVKEDGQYSKDYLAPAKRSVPNAVQLIFEDGQESEKMEVEYPIGHRFRRHEAIPVIDRKFENNLSGWFGEDKIGRIGKMFENPDSLMKMDICAFMHGFQ
ncbi:bifunctional 2-methylcitrate dehydratase/aconitate hydratase [Salinicoccus carnicancri]|uniref:bifunctional 2-methylcitrate dehydratase/aconitate hydratase n=1 Tax=Salinicoccus carnicancri TaxID=558170 RepID=UPI0002DCEEE8|nr:bifunctional 2-methylcitrate dehydratase/aconitate hydratase [Salinicoccus carnicancri]